MISIHIDSGELFNEKTEEFIKIKEHDILLEHSLVSVSKWESKWEKPFLGGTKKTNEEMLDYIRCMTITQHVDPLVYKLISNKDLERIIKYIEAPMTATWFNENGPSKGSNNKEVITAEIIYYWMVSFNIPVEFQKWHLNKLLALIKVCSIKNAPKSKMKKSEILSQNRALNQARRKSLHTKG